jgi:signal transduction histidine kinase
MSRDDHPAFHNKDANNQYTLFELMNQAEQLIADARRNQEQAAIDIRFIDIMIREGFR